MTETILGVAHKIIPMFTLKERKSTHPRLNDEVRSLVKKKCDSEGTPGETEAREACSKGILEASATYAGKEKVQLLQLRRTSKGWWTRTRRLLQQRTTSASILALKDTTGCWVLEPTSLLRLLPRSIVLPQRTRTSTRRFSPTRSRSRNPSSR